jgi:hypothetical protein
VSSHHLAQINVARLRAPLDDPEVAEFVAALDPINALAEASLGFVWRFQTEDGNATAARPYDDDLIIVNFSTWESIGALADYVYRSEHTGFLRRRREWFERMDQPVVAMWWVPAGHRPSVEEAVARLELVRRDGPGPQAFTFRVRYSPDGRRLGDDARDDCPV